VDLLANRRLISYNASRIVLEAHACVVHWSGWSAQLPDTAGRLTESRQNSPFLFVCEL
jgi:hypothetical protein